MMSYLVHRISARRRHGVHSPFIYGLGDKYLQKHHFSLLSFFSEKKRSSTAALIASDIIQYCHIHEIFNNTDLVLKPFNNRKAGQVLPALSPVPALYVSYDYPPEIRPCSIYIIVPKTRTKNMTVFLHEYSGKASPAVSILDLYYMQIVINHEMMKGSQYLKLR